MTPRARSSALAAALAAVLAASSPAAAGDPTLAERNLARALAEAGFRALQAGDYATAVDKLEHAERAFHAPTHQYFLAKALEGQGQLLRARALYQAILDERLPAGAPKAFREAQANAADALPAVEARLVRLRVVVTGPGAGAATVTVDGAPASSASPVLLEPGIHSVAATGADGAAGSSVVALREAGDRTVAIDLAIAPVARDAAPRARPYLWASGVSFGLAAIGLGVGIGAGAASLGEVRALKDACPQNPCSPEHEPLADSARALGTASTVAFVVAGVGAVAGVTLLALQPSAGSGARAALRAGPAALAVEGAFP